MKKYRILTGPMGQVQQKLNDLAEKHSELEFHGVDCYGVRAEVCIVLSFEEKSDKGEKEKEKKEKKDA